MSKLLKSFTKPNPSLIEEILTTALVFGAILVLIFTL